MSFDPSTAKLVEPTPEPVTSRFDPSKGVKLVEEPAPRFDPFGGVTKIAEGEGVSLLDYMMRGLGTYGEAMASQELPKQGVPAITVPRFGQEGTFTRGVSEGVSGLIEGTTTPEGIVAGALMPAAPITSKAIAPLFLAAGAKITGQKAGEYSVTQNPQALGEAATIGAATLLGAAAEARVAARPTPEPTPELQRLAPETAKAVEEVAKPEPKPEGAPDATQITSTDALDVRQPPENGPRMGEGNARPGTLAGTRPAETPQESRPAPIEDVRRETEQIEALPYGPERGQAKLDFIRRTSQDVKTFKPPINGDDTWVSEVRFDPDAIGYGAWRVTIQTPKGPKEGGAQFAEALNNPDMAAAKALAVEAGSLSKKGKLWDLLEGLAKMTDEDRVNFRLPGDSFSFSSKALREQEKPAKTVGIRKRPAPPTTILQPTGVPNATSLESPAAVDVRQSPENGPRMGEGNAPLERPAETPAPEAAQQPIAQPEAVASEAPVPQFTAIKNARVDAQRADRGLPPLMEPLRKSDPVLWDQAMKQIEADPTVGERLTKELLEKPRPMTDVEAVVMDHRMADLKNQLDQFRWEGSKAGDAAKAADDARRAATTPEARQAAVLAEKEARARAAEFDAQALELSNALTLVEQAVGKQSVEGGPGAGTLMGRAFRARQLLMREDFSYAGLELQKRQANQFQPLNANQLAEVRRTAEEYKAKADVYEERLKAQVEATAKAEAAKELAELRVKEAKAQAAMTGRVKALVGRVGEVLDIRANAARQRLQGKLLSLSPADLKDVAEIAAANLYHIGMDLGAWSAKMIGEFGEAIKPHLDYLWKEAQRILDESVTGEAKAPVAGKRGKPASAKDEAAVQEAIRKRIRKRIEDYEARIKSGDYSPWRKPAKKMDRQTLDAQFELEQVKRRFYEGLVADRMRQRNPVQKAFGSAVESANAMRAVLTSADVSAVLRQGLFIGLAHPIRAGKSIVPMIKALLNEKQAYRVEQEIMRRDNYALYRASKLYLAEHGVSLSKMEEAYMSRWASKLPFVGRVVRASERAYITYLNKLRADSFDAMARTLGKRGELTIEQARIVSNFINVATGRGTIPMAEQAAAGLNSVFFAPRFVASRFQMLLGQPLYYGIVTGKTPVFGKGAASARALVAKEYGQILVGASVVYGLGIAAGADVETDARSSDFGKLRFGNTRIDPLAGLSQITVLLAKGWTGEKKNLRTGRITPLRGPKVPYGGEDLDDTLARFVRYKLAPAPSLAWNITTGTDALGNPITPESIAQQIMVPISLRDIYDSMLEQGVPAGTALGVLSLFGASVQNFDVSQRR